MTNRPTTVAPSDAHSGGRRRSRRGEGDQLKDEIIAAATRLLIERGDKNAVTVRDVARAVGVTPPSIYLHFADKDVLFYECCLRGFGELAARFTRAIVGEETVLGKLRAAGFAYMRFGIEEPGAYTVLFGDSIPEHLEHHAVDDDPGLQALELLVGILDEGRGNGELRPDLDPRRTSFAVWAAVHGAVQILITKGEMREMLSLPDPETMMESTLDLILDGIRA